MNILILNGHPDSDATHFDRYLAALSTNLENRRHTVRILTLRELEARYCTGCWGCWVRTPGLCIFEDDSHTVCREAINSDLVLFSSPLIMGYLSALLKKFMDKMIPLIHPYITVVQGEAHHRLRYDKGDYPLGALLLEKTPGTDAEDIEIVEAIHNRTMLNLRSRNVFTKLTDTPVEEVANAIDRL